MPHQVIRRRVLADFDALHGLDAMPVDEQNEAMRFVLEQILAPTGRNLWSDYGLRLTPTESAYMTRLVRQSPRTVHKDDLQAIHFDLLGECASDEAIRQVIMKLRRKISHLPCRISSVWGEGYRLHTSGPVPWEA